VKKIVIDTSVLIEYVRSGQGMWNGLVKMSENNEVELFLPTVVVLELWSGKSMSKIKVEKEMVRFLSVFSRLDLSDDVAKLAGKLRREKQVDGFDAVIAATCLKEKAQLATLNKKHFEKVVGLKLWTE